MIDNEYLLQEELVEDVTAKVLEVIQPKLDILSTGYSMLCQYLAKLTIDVGIVTAKQEGKSEKEIQLLKDVANAMLDQMEVFLKENS